MDYLLFLFVCNLFPMATATLSILFAVLSCFYSASFNWRSYSINIYIFILFRIITGNVIFVSIFYCSYNTILILSVLVIKIYFIVFFWRSVFRIITFVTNNKSNLGIITVIPQRR